MNRSERTLIDDGIAIIEQERDIIFRCYKEADGVVRDRYAKAELRKYDRWLARARKALESRA